MSESTQLYKQAAKRSPILADAAFLFVISLISSAPFVSHLGFYIDDWANIAQFAHRNLIDGLQAMLTIDRNMRTRPGQFIYLALNIKAFGLNPLGYHVVSAIMFAFLSFCVYLTGIALSLPRLLAVTIALTFSLLPHYSSDRIWISSPQAALCMIFALLGICALLRSIKADTENPAVWSLISAMLFTFSLLSYEISLGLIGAVIAAAIWNKRAAMRNSGRPALPAIHNFVGIVILLIFVFIAKALYLSRVPSHVGSIAHFFRHLPKLIEHALSQMVQFTFWTYGLRLPKVVIVMHELGALSLAAIATAGAIAVLVTSYLWRISYERTFPKRHNCIQLLALSILLFFLGYGLFFNSISTDFTTSGIPNRITIASALAPACVLPSLLALICSLLPLGPIQHKTFAVSLGLACAMNSLAMSGISHFWIQSASEQKMILNSLTHHLPQLPNGSTVLLDGFCRYRGPAVVFEGDWDTTGAVQLALDNFKIDSDVLSNDLRLADNAVDSWSDGASTHRYFYGGKLYVFNLRDRSLTTLNSSTDAKTYMRSKNPMLESPCPSNDGENGVKLF